MASRASWRTAAGHAGCAPVYDRERSRALFVRNGDLSARSAQPLLQLSHGGDAVGAPQFSADGASAQFRRGSDWFSVDLASRLVSQLAVLKAERIPPPGPGRCVARAQWN